MCPRPPVFRCQRDQKPLLDPARASGAEFCRQPELAPTDPLPVVGFNPKDQERSLTVMRWGLVPFWAKDIKVGGNINAKAEGNETKPALREAFRQRCCLVPVDNFDEWKKTGTGKRIGGGSANPASRKGRRQA